jgi:phosphoribosylaminoimidazolecarboxamide formyltransferase/IMP cyclohydrolase
MIAEYMRAKAGLSEKLFIEADLKQELRYGENPHQKAKFYVTDKDASYSLANAVQIQGKELSYNNIQDANAALNIVREFGNQPFAMGLKHMNPCGAAIGKDLKEAWLKAYESDPVSIFGGIVATNQVIDGEAANLIKFDHGEKGKSIFLEVILAPGYTEEALKAFSKRPDLRILQYKLGEYPKCKQYVSVNGGLLVQDQDTECKTITEDMTITSVKPTPEQLSDMDFGWKIVKHVKSNAIVVVKNGVTCGVGAGQMNRVGAAKIAIEEAHSRGVMDGMTLASDAFFPFSDTLEYGIANGVSAVVQPGGSKRDQDSIDLANEKNVPMAFTGMRHFKH